MSRIERTGVLQWGAIIAGGGVARGVTTLGGGGNVSGGDAAGGGTTLGYSISDFTEGCGRMGGGFSEFDLVNIRGVASLGIDGIGWGSQLLNSSCSLVIAVSCPW